MIDVAFSPKPLTKDDQAWVADKDAQKCSKCEAPFSVTNRKHHCRNCGKVFCNTCCFSHLQLPGWTSAERVCEVCLMAHARHGRSAPTEVAGGVDGLLIESAMGSTEYHDILVDSQKDGVTARGAANVTLIRCHIKAQNSGISKSGAGYVTLTDCEVTAKEGVSLSGGVKLTISGGVIMGEEACVRARGSCVLTLENCHIVCKEGTAIECYGACKVELVNCTVTGKVGIHGSGSCEFTIKGGCVSSQNTLHPLLMKAPVDFPGKSGATLKLIGPCKVTASDGAVITGNHQLSKMAKVQL